MYHRRHIPASRADRLVKYPFLLCVYFFYTLIPVCVAFPLAGVRGGGGGRGGGEEVRWEIPHENTAMLIVSLRGIDQGFWSHLGCSGPTLLLLAVKASLKLHLKNKIIKFFLTRERFFLH